MTFHKLFLSQMDAFQPIIPTTTNCPSDQVLATYMIMAEPILPSGCTVSFLNTWPPNPFVPGWHTTSEIHNPSPWPCVTTQHNPIIPFHPGGSFDLVVLLRKHKSLDLEYFIINYIDVHHPCLLSS